MKNLFMTFCFLIFVMTVSSQEFITYNHRIYGGIGNDAVYDVITYDDDGQEFTVIAGASSPESNLNQEYRGGFNDVLVAKLDESNNLVWSVNYGGTEQDVANAIVPTSDGGFLVAATTRSADGDVSINAGPGFQDFWILKLDGLGQLEWEKSFGGIVEDIPLDMIATSDGNFIIGGTAQSGSGDNTTNQGGYDFWLLKIDSEGEVIWREIYGGNNTDHLESLIETSDGSIVCVGWSESTSGGDVSENYGFQDVWVVKTDEMGQLLWERNFGGSSWDRAYEIMETTDGDYFIFGMTESNDFDVSQNNGSSDFWLLKTDEEGELLWERTYGGSEYDEGYDFKILNTENDMILLGITRSSDGDFDLNRGDFDGGVFQVDGEGEILQSLTTGGTDEDFAFALFPKSGNELVAVGTTKSGDDDLAGNELYGNRDNWIFTIGYSPLSVNSLSDEEYSLFPNPSQGQFTVDFNLSKASHYRIYDSVGREVYHGTIGPCTICNVEIPESGSFLFEIETEDGIFRERVLIKK